MRLLLALSLLLCAVPAQAQVAEIFIKRVTTDSDSIAFAVRQQDTLAEIIITSSTISDELALPIDRDTLIEIFHFGDPDYPERISVELSENDTVISLIDSLDDYRESATAAELFYRVSSADILRTLAQELAQEGYEFAHWDLITR